MSSYRVALFAPPASIMFIGVSVLSPFASSMGLAIAALFLAFPVIFGLQGIMCSRHTAPITQALTLSTLAFVALVAMYMNYTALVYVPAYLAIGLSAHYVATYRKARSE
jgi:hypothetical protein